MFEGCYTVVLSSQGRRRLREGQEPAPLCKLFESKKCPLFFSYTLRDNFADFEKMAEGNLLSGTEMAEVIFRERSDGGGGDVATRGSVLGRRGADVT